MLRRALFWTLLLAAVARLFLAAGDSHDFDVYWIGGRAWLDGANPYVIRPDAYGMLFKYPPWILPLFAPIALLPLDMARYAWGVLELGSLAYTVSWVMRAGVGRRLVLTTTAAFWWIWLGHFHAGQITLPLLAVALWAFSRREHGAFAPWAPATALFLWSSKVFSILTFAGFGRRALRPAVAALALAAAAHAALLAGHTTLAELYSGWGASAASGGAELGSATVRGPANHGLTALVLRTAGVSATDARADVLAALAVFAALAALWTWAVRSARRGATELSPEAEWSGWLAAGLLAHPLAWHHSFVLAFPLAAFALAKAVSLRSRARVGVAVAGIACIGLLLPQTLGNELAKTLELAGLKAWGVLLCAAALAWPVSSRHN